MNVLISHQELLEAAKGGTFLPHHSGTGSDDCNNSSMDAYLKAYNTLDMADKTRYPEEDPNKFCVLSPPTPPSEPNTSSPKTPASIKHLKAERSLVDMIKEREKWNTAALKKKTLVIRTKDVDAKKETEGYLHARIDQIQSKIKTLKEQLASVSNSAPTSATAINPPVRDEHGDPINDDDTRINPELTRDTRTSLGPFSWTTVTTKVSQSNSVATKLTEETANKFAAKASFGLWNVSAGASHANASAEAASSIQNPDADISMDCMLVEIERPWLHGESRCNKRQTITFRWMQTTPNFAHTQPHSSSQAMLNLLSMAILAHFNQ